MDKLYSIFKIKRSELTGALLSFLFVFILMAAWMILRPVRDSLPSDWGDVGLAEQWTYTFLVSIIAVSLYNFLAAKISLKKMVPGTFVFFAASFFLLYSMSKYVDGDWLGKTFYIWSSVFSLFHVSVFWSFTSQAYSKSQSKRVFAFINTGASAGAILGSLGMKYILKDVPLEYILLLACGALVAVLPLIFFLNKEYEKSSNHKKEVLTNLNSNPFKGLSELFSSQKLLGIAGFIFLFTALGTVFYIAQSEALVEYGRSERKALLSSLDIWQNVATILLGIFAANRISSKFGLATSLSLVPFTVAILLLLLSLNPIVMFILALQLVRKSGNYAITRPAREILFTGVSKEARFKTKPIIDVAIYRGGDVFWVWAFAILGDGYFNFTLSQKLWVGAGIAVVWGALGVYLGKNHSRLEENEKDPDDDGHDLILRANNKPENQDSKA